MSFPVIANNVIGATKSKTVWFGVLCMVLPYIDPITAALAPVLGAKAVSLIGAVVVGLRAVTNTALSDK